jgi:hypothetical protein
LGFLIVYSFMVAHLYFDVVLRLQQTPSGSAPTRLGKEPN